MNNTKQAKTTCLISRTFYHQRQVDSKPRRHFCLPNNASDHTPSRAQYWVDTFPLNLWRLPFQTS